MAQEIESNFKMYLSGAISGVIWLAILVFAVAKKTKRMEKAKLKLIIRIGTISLGICLVLCTTGYHFGKIAVAYYEFSNDATEETMGIVDHIERTARDRISLTIDNKKYTVVHYSSDPVFDFERDIRRGDTVQIRYGKTSKFIFDIYELK